MIEKIKREHIRGEILKSLQREYFDGIPGQSIAFGIMRQVLHTLGMSLLEQELVGHLCYLEALEYISITRYEDRIMHFTITAKGIKLCEGYIKDDSISFI